MQLKSLFMGDTRSIPIDCVLDFSNLELYGAYPLQEPIRVTGQVENRTGIVRLTANVAYVLDTTCDRCMTPLHRESVLPIEHILVASLNREDADDLILVEDHQLPLDELVEADLILSLPMKTLCREDCRGLCPMCGKNLNDGLCGCRTESVDPRLAVLKDLLDT
ncbi:MAG: DUF177 domain-containing protein [Clostridia bacterium]|nr:DUF177 domain-containing protein [Clostridia bacterium]